MGEEVGRMGRDYLEDIAQKSLELNIDRSLAVRDFTPPLHLPMLAALQEGPGIPGLSCLGLLSDRILYRYVESSLT